MNKQDHLEIINYYKSKLYYDCKDDNSKAVYLTARKYSITYANLNKILCRNNSNYRKLKRIRVSKYLKEYKSLSYIACILNLSIRQVYRYKSIYLLKTYL